MPGTTATQKLTYPTSGDNLKEQAQYLETLARQVDARTHASATVLARQLNRPFAVVDCTVQHSILATQSDSLVQFDSVVIDTAGMVDFSSDRRVINFNSTGYWLVGGYVDFVGTPGGSNCASIGSLILNLNCDNTDPDRWSNYVKDHNTGHSYLHASGLTKSTDPVNLGRVYMSAQIADGTGCTNILNVFTARMWAFKAREL